MSVENAARFIQDLNESSELYDNYLNALRPALEELTGLAYEEARNQGYEFASEELSEAMQQTRLNGISQIGFASLSCIRLAEKLLDTDAMRSGLRGISQIGFISLS